MEMNYIDNMNINEYRHLLKNQRFLLVIDKPLTRVLPEIYEETDTNFSVTNIQSQTSFQIKKNNEQVIKKKSIF